MSPDTLPNQPKKRKWLNWWTALFAGKAFLIVSIVVHLLLGVGATYYVVQTITAKRKMTFAAGPPVVNASSRALEHKVSMAKKKNTMSAPAQAKRITTTGISRVALPEMPSMPHATDVVANKMAGLGGTGNGFGTGGGGGMGTGGAGFGFALPVIMGDRCSAASRAKAMRASGGDPRSEESILKGLRWLKAHQNDDGSFGQEYRVAMTGLALLSFMGHCERPTSQEFGPNVRKAIDYLVQEGQDGQISKVGGNAWVYEHGIATYALGETYILTKEQKVGDVFQKATRKIIEGQGGDGGWVYNFTKEGDGDTSVSGWQIQALKVAHLSGLKIAGAEESMKKAMDNMIRVRGGKGGFGYHGPEDRWSLTPVGVFCLQIGRNERGLAVRQGLKFFVDDPAAPKIKYDDGGANLYAWYYGTQACFQYGGSYWQKWNRDFQPEINNHQSPDGSWPPTGSREGGGGGLHWTGTGASMDAQVYRTSLCILMLEVYYRYLASSRG